MNKAIEKEASGYTQSQNKKLINLLISVIFLLSTLTAGAVSGMFALFPLKTKEIDVVSYDQASNRWVSVTKSNKLKGDKLLIQNFLAGYVKDRQTVNHIDDQERFEKIVSFSGEEVKGLYVQEIKDHQKVYSDSKFRREIEIGSSTLIGDKVGEVEFKTKDYHLSADKWEEIGTDSFKATMQFQFVDRKVTVDKAHLNPLGFEIVAYQVTRRTFK